MDAPPKEATWGSTIATRTDGDSGVTGIAVLPVPIWMTDEDATSRMVEAALDLAAPGPTDA